jgi:hypothetical protein
MVINAHLSQKEAPYHVLAKSVGLVKLVAWLNTVIGVKLSPRNSIGSLKGWQGNE